MDLHIQLTTFPGCPNASAARTALERALAEAEVTGQIEEIDTSAPDTPASLRDWGSPTILVNGEDVGGEPTGQSCRLYRDDAGPLQGTPPQALLTTALQRAIRLDRRKEENRYGKAND